MVNTLCAAWFSCRSRNLSTPLRCAGLLLALAASLPAEDVVELKTGAKPKGKLISQDAAVVVLEIQVGGKTFTRRYPRSQVKAVILGDGSTPAAEGSTGSAAPSSRPGQTRNKKEVLDLIDQVGRTPPDWFEAAPLNFPQTLDLSWPEKPGAGWNNQKNVGQYIWDRVNPNPGQWQHGVKLLHHVMSVNQGNTEVINRAMQALGTMYHNLHEDYARAAFWWHQAGVDKSPDNNPNNAVHLANCYLKLGNPQMGLDLINRMQRFPYSTIKLLGDLGEPNDALQMAERFAKQNPQAAVVCYLYGGDVCRTAGRLDEAEAYYRKALQAAQADTRNNDHSKRDEQRAQASLAAIEFFRLTPDKVKDGVYKSSSLGYEDQVEVTVTVAAGRIESVRVTNHREKQFYSSIADTPRNILARQSVIGVDTTSGATITSEAIINSTAKALSQGLSP